MVTEWFCVYIYDTVNEKVFDIQYQNYGMYWKEHISLHRKCKLYKYKSFSKMSTNYFIHRFDIFDIYIVNAWTFTILILKIWIRGIIKEVSIFYNWEEMDLKVIIWIEKKIILFMTSYDSIEVMINNYLVYMCNFTKISLLIILYLLVIYFIQSKKITSTF